MFNNFRNKSFVFIFGILFIKDTVLSVSKANATKDMFTSYDTLGIEDILGIGSDNIRKTNKINVSTNADRFIPTTEIYSIRIHV